jgi:hypothetical protein
LLLRLTAVSIVVGAIDVRAPFFAAVTRHPQTTSTAVAVASERLDDADPER